MTRGRVIIVAAALTTAAAVAVALGLSTGGASAGEHKSEASIPKDALRLTVSGPMKVHPIRPGFLGLSIEYPSIEPYAGTDPHAINPVLVQLIRNLTPNQSPVIRIGGDSTDWEWWPVPNMRRPGGVKFTLTRTWVAVTKALTQQLNARLILGLDLEANSLPLARTEATHLVGGIGRQYIAALEPGNEPELYGTWAWYRAPDGRRVTGRPSTWDIGDYAKQVASLKRGLGTTPIAGPATGGRQWMAKLPQFLNQAPYLKLLTIHRYPLQLCYTPPSRPQYPTIGNLLSPIASRALAAGARPYIRLAHAHGIQASVDEINTNSCGAAPSVTKSFASALWATDALFAMAAAGADGVNIHTYAKSSYELFEFGHTGGGWRARVEPEYYGLYLFALGAPPNSRLLDLGGPATQALRTWATSAPDGRVRITLINDDRRHSRTVAIRLGGPPTTATLTRMTAPGAAAHAGVRIAGLGFGPSTHTGTLTGRYQPTAVSSTRGEYVVRVPPASAALLVR